MMTRIEEWAIVNTEALLIPVGGFLSEYVLVSEANPVRGKQKETSLANHCSGLVTGAFNPPPAH